jgi:hypothetical protein
MGRDFQEQLLGKHRPLHNQRRICCKMKAGIPGHPTNDVVVNASHMAMSFGFLKYKRGHNQFCCQKSSALVLPTVTARHSLEANQKG